MAKKDPLNDVITSYAAAKLLRRGHATIRRYLIQGPEKGGLYGKKLGKAWVTTLQALEQFKRLEAKSKPRKPYTRHKQNPTSKT